jgi:transposase
MKPYSNELRQKVIDAYYNAEGSLRKLAARFSVSLNFVWLLLERFRQTGCVDPKPHGGGQPPKIQGEDLDTLQRLVERHNNATLPERRDLFVRHTGVRVSASAISRALKRLHITRKKIDYHASERDQDPKIGKARAAFRHQQRRTKALDHGTKRGVKTSPALFAGSFPDWAVLVGVQGKITQSGGAKFQGIDKSRQGGFGKCHGGAGLRLVSPLWVLYRTRITGTVKRTMWIVHNFDMKWFASFLAIFVFDSQPTTLTLFFNVEYLRSKSWKNRWKADWQPVWQ